VVDPESLNENNQGRPIPVSNNGHTSLASRARTGIGDKLICRGKREGIYDGYYRGTLDLGTSRASQAS